MFNICPVCGKEKHSWTTYKKQPMCINCAQKLKKEDILNEASKADSALYFKDWSNKDRSTAFFEAFGRYQKEPNERDLQTILQLRCWAAHADHGLSVTMSYIFDWAKFDIYNEQRKLKEQKEVN